MKKYAVLSVYRCVVGKKNLGDRDFQVVLIKARNPVEAIRAVASRKRHGYKNPYGDTVSWPLVDIMAVSDVAECGNGEELMGFIAQKDELFGKRSLIKPSLSYLLRDHMKRKKNASRR